MLFKDFPIKRKLRAVILLTSAVVLFLTCAAFITYELISFRGAAQENLQTLGEIMADNSTAALAFRDEEVARKVLASLQAEPNIVAAALYDDDGTLFVRFPTNNGSAKFPGRPAEDGARFEGSNLILFEPVQESGKRFGTLYLESNLRAMYRRFQLYGGITLLVFATSLVVAFLLSNLLQKSISQPIISLAHTARIISEKNDYSVRAKKESDDELGLLTDAFNQMLAEIHLNQVRLNQALEETRRSEQKVKELNLGLERRVLERTAELEEAVAQMEAFSYSVSHDLRAPLRSMQGFSQALIEDYGDQLDDTVKDYLNRIRTSSIRMDRLIQDILSYSRAARSELKLGPVNLEKVINDIIQQSSAFQAPAAEIKVESPLLPVRGHESALSQCLYNLLTNAVKFVAPNTKPKIRIWTEAVGSNVVISVQDNGIGINPEYRDRIFGMFERIDGRNYEGTGIGLAIVKKSVERMGGRVSVDSAEGQGSRFTILLPKA